MSQSTVQRTHIAGMDQDQLFQWLMTTERLECLGVGQKGSDVASACMLGKVRDDDVGLVWLGSVNVVFVTQQGTRETREFWGEQATRLSERLKSREWY